MILAVPERLPPPPYELSRFTAAEPHGPRRGFVMTSFVDGVNELGLHRVSRATLLDHLRRPETTCVVAAVEGAPDDVMGWACARGPALVWVYVRASQVVRRRGLATIMLAAVGIDPRAPTPCLYWSRTAALLVARGWRLNFDPTNETAKLRGAHS